MQNTVENDALFTKETKDASGKTTLIEREYLFYETNNYDYNHGEKMIITECLVLL